MKCKDIFFFRDCVVKEINNNCASSYDECNSGISIGELLILYGCYDSHWKWCHMSYLKRFSNKCKTFFANSKAERLYFENCKEN